MYIIIYSFAFAIALWLVTFVTIAYIFAERSWKFHVLTQLLLMILIWPVAELTAQVMFYFESSNFHAGNINELSINWDIPEQCTDISYHRDPTGRWFFCKIDDHDAMKWLSDSKFSYTDQMYCGPYDEVATNIEEFRLDDNLEHFNTVLEIDGAGSAAIIGNSHLFVCQWFW